MYTHGSILLHILNVLSVLILYPTYYIQIYYTGGYVYLYVVSILKSKDYITYTSFSSSSYQGKNELKLVKESKPKSTKIENTHFWNTGFGQI